MELQLFGCVEVRHGTFEELPDIADIEFDDELLEEMCIMLDNMEPEDRKDFFWIEIEEPTNELEGELEDILDFALYDGGACIVTNTFFFWRVQNA